MIRWCLLVAGLLGNLLATAQSPVPVYSSREQPTPFIKKNGAIAFSLPPGHEPILEYPSGSFVITITDQQELSAFANGICPVKRPDGSFYWINDKGKQVKDFGKSYTQMAPAVEGYSMAWQPYEGRKGASWLLYLNKDGENAFGNKRYWEAAPFSEGYAAVQLENEKGAWGYIDRSGELVIRPQLPNVFKLESFSNGLALVTTNTKTPENNYNFNYYYINTRGEVVIKVDQLMPDKKRYSVKSFSDGLAVISYYRTKDRFYDVVYIDTQGKIALSFESIESFSSFQKGVASLVIGTPVSKRSFTSDPFLIDKKGKRVELLLPKEEEKTRIMSVYPLNQHYFAATLVKEEELYKAIFAPTGKMLYQTRHSISGAASGLVLERVSKDHQQLYSHKGKLLWETPVAERTFTNLQEALVHKHEVRQFKSEKESDLQEGLFELKNLRKLTLSSWAKELPEAIGDMQKLQELEISFMYILEKMPESLKKLQQLERLEITQCDKLKGVEALVEQLPNLKHLYLYNYELKPGFEKRMKLERPELVIDEITTIMDITEIDVVLED